MMRVIHVASGTEQVATVSEVKGKELADLIKSRFIFDWKRLSNTTKIYKIKLEDSNLILGAIGIIDWPEEFRVEINMKKYKMKYAGWQLYIDSNNLLELLNEYL